MSTQRMIVDFMVHEGDLRGCVWRDGAAFPIGCKLSEFGRPWIDFGLLLTGTTSGPDSNSEYYKHAPSGLEFRHVKSRTMGEWWEPEGQATPLEPMEDEFEDEIDDQEDDE